jgi:hypothetical protein
MPKNILNIPAALIVIANILTVNYGVFCRENAPGFPFVRVSNNKKAGQVNCAGSPLHLSGTLIQYQLAMNWTPAQWKEEFQYMKKACISQVIIQYTADSTSEKGKITIYPTTLEGYKQISSTDTINNIFTAAMAENIDVYLGLQNNKKWDEGDHKDNYEWIISQEVKESTEIAGEIYKLYKDHPGFKKRFQGWYLPFEFDNVHFDLTGKIKSAQNLDLYYRKVGDVLHKLTAGKKIVISPFYNVSGLSNGSLDQAAENWRKLLTFILSSGSIDIIAPQDGIGAKNKVENLPHAVKEQLPKMFAATKKAIKESGEKVELWANSETYVERRDGMVGDERKPMAIKELVDDMDAVKLYVTNYISFSFNHYMSPQQGWAAYYNTYMDYLARGKTETAPPLKPAITYAVSLDHTATQFNWETSGSDAVGIKLYRDNKVVRLSYDPVPGGKGAWIDSMLLSPKTKYEYRLAAFDAAGNESESVGVTLQTPDFLDNFALGKPYSFTLRASELYPDKRCVGADPLNCQKNSGMLVDGRPQDSLEMDYIPELWQGRDTSAPYSFTIDLENESAVKEIESDWLQRQGDGILLPKTVTYYISADNKDFERVGIVNKPAVNNVDQPCRYGLTGLNKTGRFVKIEVTPDKQWSFVEEVRVKRDF